MSERLPPGLFRRKGTSMLWIKWYDASGVAHRESARSASIAEAKRLRSLRLASVAKGEPVAANAGRWRIGDLLDDLESDYRVNDQVLRAIAPNVTRLRRAFGQRRAVVLTTSDLRAYIAQHQRTAERPDGLSNGTLNRDLSALRRAYALARQGTPPKLTYTPHFPMLKEATPRQGFFEAEQFEAVRRHHPDDLRPVVTFAYITGWRTPSEVLTLTWAQVDFAAGTVRLEPGTTKNDEARTFPFTDELRALLDAQRARTDAVQRTTGRIIPFVFHRDGAPIRDYRGAWRTACTKAGLPGRIPHDFRRTAIRNMIRAGIPERVAMQLSGHKTRSVFDRYNIVSEGDLRDAASKLTHAAAPKLTGTVTGTVVALGARSR